MARSKKLAENSKKYCEVVSNKQLQRELRQHAVANNYRKKYGYMHTKKPDQMPSSGIRSEAACRTRKRPASAKKQLDLLQILVTPLMVGPPVACRDLIHELAKINNRLTTLKSNPAYKHTNLPTIIHIHRNIQTYIKTYRYIYTCIQTYIHTHIHTYIQTYIHIQSYKRIYIHTNIHTKYTYIYIYNIQIYTYKSSVFV